MAHEVIYIGNDNLIQIVALKDVKTGQFVNSAVLKATLKDSAGVDVPGAINLPLDYIVGSNGDYTGQLEDSVLTDAADGAEYLCVIDSTTQPKYHAERVCVARKRRE